MKTKEILKKIFSKTISSHSIVLTSFMMHKKFEMQQISCVLHITCAKVWNKKEVMSINKLMSTFSHLHFMFKHEPKCVGFGDLKNWIRKNSFEILPHTNHAKFYIF